METQELFEKIEILIDVFKEEHEGTSKAAHARARKALSEVKKLITLYNKASVAENKK